MGARGWVVPWGSTHFGPLASLDLGCRDWPQAPFLEVGRGQHVPQLWRVSRVCMWKARLPVGCPGPALLPFRPGGGLSRLRVVPQQRGLLLGHQHQWKPGPGGGCVTLTQPSVAHLRSCPQPACVPSPRPRMRFGGLKGILTPAKYLEVPSEQGHFPMMP